MEFLTYLEAKLGTISPCFSREEGLSPWIITEMTKRELSKFGIHTGDECLLCGRKNPLTIPSFTSPLLGR